MAKDIKIVYQGAATIKSADYQLYKDFDGGLGGWIYKQLAEDDRETAYELQLFVEGGGESGMITIEVSHRELKGAMLERYAREDGKTATQTDLALSELTKRGIVKKCATDDETIASALSDAVGKEVDVQLYREADGDGGYYPTVKARFAFPRSRISALEKFRKAAPASAPAPSDDAAAVAAPDPDDFPF